MSNILKLKIKNVLVMQMYRFAYNSLEETISLLCSENFVFHLLVSMFFFFCFFWIYHPHLITLTARRMPNLLFTVFVRTYEPFPLLRHYHSDSLAADFGSSTYTSYLSVMIAFILFFYNNAIIISCTSSLLFWAVCGDSTARLQWGFCDHSSWKGMKQSCPS